MSRFKKSLCLLVMLSVLLAACASPQAAPTAEPTPDLNAYATTVARQVLAGLTATAAVWTPTPEPPTNTPEPTVTNTPEVTATAASCNLVRYIADVNFPDGTSIAANTEFIKTWRVQNVGSCPWLTGYKLVFSYPNEAPAGWKTASVALTKDVAPGETIELSITLKAPATAGTYTAAWGMVTDKGIAFPQVVTLQIIVPNP